MKLVKSFVAHSYRQGKPFGRHSFNNGPKGMASHTPEKSVVPRGSGAPGLALFFGYTGYLIWQMVELRRITKAAEKGIEYHRQARLWSTRVSEGHDEICRLIAVKDLDLDVDEDEEAEDEDEEAQDEEEEDEDEDEDEPEAIPEAKHSGKKAEEDMEMPWWCGSA